MPAKSPAQRRLMEAAAHGATFPKAQAIRRSMTMKQIGDFTQSAAPKAPTAHPHANLGKWLHEKKAR